MACTGQVRRWALGFCFAMAVGLVFSPGAAAGDQGRTWYIDDDAPGDPGPKDPLVSDPLEDGSSEHPFDAIQEAIDVAANGDLLVARPGVYRDEGNYNLDFKGKALHLKGSDDPQNTLIVAAENSNGLRFVSNEGPDTVVEGFLIGMDERLYGVDSVIYCVGSSPTITNCIIRGGRTLKGGGLYCSNSSPQVIDCEFSDNEADRGGGIYLVDGSEAVIEDCRIMGNRAVFGGGIFVDYASPAVNGNLFVGNMADYGGGMFIGSGEPLVANNTFDRNYSLNSGAGIACDGLCSPLIVNNLVVDNIGYHGVGISTRAGAAPTISNNIISGNFAFDRDGGGLYNRSGCNSTIVDNIIADNRAGHHGGGIFICYSAPMISGNVISGNWTEFDGAGINCYTDVFATIIDNLITGNEAMRRSGGIASYYGGASLIHNNVIQDNVAGWHGGGIGIWRDSLPIVTCNAIIGNTAGPSYGGGGLHVETEAVIAGNLIAHNRAPFGGGAFCRYSNITIDTTTFADNIAEGVGGGLSCTNNSTVKLTNSIVWGNQAPEGSQMYLHYNSMTLKYCNVQNLATSVKASSATTLIVEDGVIQVDPLFADPANGDYHLKSIYGRWKAGADGEAGEWVTDDVTSPCIDAGDPAAECINEPMPNGGVVNLGAYGNTIYASLSGQTLPADVTGDCIVNVLDLITVRNLLGQNPSTDGNGRADVNRDGVINVLDLITVRNNLGTHCD